MSDEGTDGRDGSARRTRGLEVAITAALGIGAVVTALTVYLVNDRDNDAQRLFNEGVAATTEATGLYVEGLQHDSADEALFVEYAKASQEDPELAQYLLRDLMRDELREMVLWWLDTDHDSPFVDENPHFAQQAQLEEAEQLTAVASESFDQATEKQKQGSRFVLVGVIIATSLFLWGIAGVLHSFDIRARIFAIGSATFLVALGILVTGL